MRSNKGFTLIELMVVIAIIAIIAAIAIPSLLESRKAANERSAIGLLRAVHTAQTLYRDRDVDKNGRHDFARMSGPLRSHFSIPHPQDSKPHSGYVWGVLDDPSEPVEDAYFAIAVPIAPGKSGDRIFSIDETGLIRFAGTDAITGGTVEPSYAALRTWLPLGHEGETTPPPPMN